VGRRRHESIAARITLRVVLGCVDKYSRDAGDERESVVPVVIHSEEPSDEDLIDRAKAGDTEALGVLWLRHLEFLRRVVTARCWIVPPDMREDYVDDLYVVVARRISGYHEHGSGFKVFLAFTAQQQDEQWRFVKKYREVRTVPLQPERDGKEQPVRELADASAQLEDSVLGRVTLPVLLEKIFALDVPPHQLVVFGFHRLLKMTPNDIVKDLWYCRLKSLLSILAGGMFFDTVGKVDISEFLSPLWPKMDLPLGEVLRSGPSRMTYEGLSARVTGELRLSDYAGCLKLEKPEVAVGRWTDNVLHSVCKILESMRESAANRHSRA
jgi:hypothetical protein